MSAVTQFDGTTFTQDDGHHVSPLLRTSFGLRHMAFGHHHQPVFTTFRFIKKVLLFTQIDGFTVKIGDGEPVGERKYLISLEHQRG